MLREFFLTNFKRFDYEQRVPLRPITLVYGPNSGGKSSVLQAMALAHEALRTGNLDVVRTEIGGTAIDLGGFGQYVHRREAERRVSLGFGFDVARLPPELAKHFTPAPERLVMTVTFGVDTDDQGRPRRGEVPKVTTVEVMADDEPLLRLVRRGDGRLALASITPHPIVRDILQAVLTTSTTATTDVDDAELIADVLRELAGAIVAREGHLLPEALVDETRGGTATLPEVLRIQPVRRGERLKDIAEAARLILPRKLSALVGGLCEAVRGEFRRLQYLGPLRSFPPRYVGVSDTDDPNWRAGGGEAWERLLRDATVREPINRWLGDERWMRTPYRLDVKDHLAAEEVEAFVRELLEKLSEDGDPLEDPEAAAKEFITRATGEARRPLRTLVLVDRRNDTPVTHRDVGIGVSQVLPVLVHAFGARGEIVAMEQPELHLHPRLQAELGDVFIRGARNDPGNVFLLETHSEHLLLRLMRRLRETDQGTVPPELALRPDDVQVLYVESDGAHSLIREMPLNARGELVRPWPGGFFEEGFDEVFS